MGFILFILVNATLFLRPPELVESWKEFKFYEPLILACLLASSFDLLALFFSTRLRQQPLTLLIFALLPLIFLSNMANVDVDNALEMGFEFVKVLVYYLLLLAVVNTPARLKQFLFWITIFAGLITLLAVFQYEDVITLNTLEAMKDNRGDGTVHLNVFKRLRGTGIFADPNDFASLLVVVLPLSLYWLTTGQQSQFARLLWLPVFCLFAYALMLTQSRGGQLAALVGILALVYARWGPRPAAGLILVLLPLGLLVMASRQTTFKSEDTSQNRFQQWQEGLALLKDYPILGVGMNQFEKKSPGDLVAHNAFMHCYGELGFVGGTVFFGAFFFAIWSLYRVNSRQVVVLDPISRGLNAFLFAAVAAYTAALMSLSRSYVVPTYMVLGLVTVHLQQTLTYPDLPVAKLNSRLVQRLALASVGFLGVIYVTCRLLVRYSS